MSRTARSSFSERSGGSSCGRDEDVFAHCRAARRCRTRRLPGQILTRGLSGQTGRPNEPTAVPWGDGISRSRRIQDVARTQPMADAWPNIPGAHIWPVGAEGPRSPPAWDHRTGPLCHAADIVWTSQGMIPISRRRPEGCPFRGGELTGGLNRQPRPCECATKRSLLAR
jgi:hypothetical protein